MHGVAQDFWLDELGQADAFNDWVFSTIEPWLGRSVLEVGCGIGSFTRRFAASGRRVTAVDINPAYVADAQRRVAASGATFLCGDATVMEWKSSFDTIILLDVLEHVADDIGFLVRLAGALDHGGRIVVKVPAGEWLHGPMDAAIGHHRRYSRTSIARTFADAGLATASLRPFNAAGMLGWWLNGKMLGRATPPGAQVGFFNRIVPAMRRLESMARPPFGLSLIAVGTPAEGY